MAQISRRLPQNVPGNWYVDSTCIDCDTCRQIAPDFFRDHGGHSSVYRQPQNEREQLRATMALVSCPTASIGTRTKLDTRAAVEAFPQRLADDVFFCGFTSESSYGGWGYLIVRPENEGGNLLVDSPRFTAPLVRRISEMGGVGTMFLTHRDDIADHAKFAAEFGCRRIMHANDGASRLGIEFVIEGDEPVALASDLLVIPTPGHTPGHMVLLYRDRFLFTGDHLAWSPEAQTLEAYRDYCWHSWQEQTRSMERLLDYRFEWVLPGHGRIGHDSAERMHEHLSSLVAAMKDGR
jgi:glyoxylase-like metal-dependent hydrolase (beta-lactamase superfamily II)/ferredoxin